MAIASKALLWLVACAYFTFVDAFWRMRCGIIQSGRVDPIINPGAIASHAHKISGPSNFGISSTFESLTAASCTSCEITKDRSAYWTPQLYYKHTNGSFEEVKGSGAVVYYLSRGENRKNMVPFPPGFRMVSGDNGLRRYDNTTLTPFKGRPIADRVSFACLDKKPAAEQPYMYRTDCAYGMRAQVHFQSCWDGQNLYKTDQSHVAYMSDMDNGRCPLSHPVQLPHIFLENLYDVNNIDKSKGGVFVFANGDSTGYGYHGDFLNGWNMEVQKQALKQCMGDGSAGTLEECPTLLASQDPHFAWNCPERPPVINEKVKGLLDRLPGCNVVTGFQEGRASNTNCSAPLNNPVQDGLPIFKPTPGTKLNNWSYLGCAKGTYTTRALSGPKYGGDLKVTIDVCHTFCARGGYPIAGLEYGRECWCGNSLAATNPIQSPSVCASIPQMVCAGNATEYCGAPNLVTLWNNTAFVPNQIPPSTGGGVPNPDPLPVVPYPIPGVTRIADNKALYVGCYSEVPGRALKGVQFVNNTGMTNELCASYCMSRNYALFGTEYSQECYCASSLATGSSFKQKTECPMRCTGNPTDFCGGASRLSLWNNTNYVAPRNPPTPNNQYGYVGCFTEGKGGRALGASAGGTSFVKSDLVAMTVETCASICFSKGYDWMGVEFGQECYCNKDGPINNAVAAPNGDKECNMLCKGDNKQFCGGSSRLNLYRKIRSTRPAMGRRGLMSSGS